MSALRGDRGERWIVDELTMPGLQPGGWRFDPARLHSMLNESDRITSHLLFQRPKSEPSALNLARTPSSSLRHLRHLRHCVIPIEAGPPAAIRRAHQQRSRWDGKTRRCRFAGAGHCTPAIFADDTDYVADPSGPVGDQR